MLAARIEGHVHPPRLDVAKVGELAGLELVEEPLAGHDLDHVAARHRHVVGAELARLERGQHRLVGIVGVHGHLDPVLGGKLVEELLREVLEPVVDRELPLGLRRAGEERQRHRHGPRFQISVHADSSLWIGGAAPRASAMAVADRVPPRLHPPGRRRRRRRIAGLGIGPEHAIPVHIPRNRDRDPDPPVMVTAAVMKGSE